MAGKTTEVTPQKEEVPEKEGPETPPDSPLLDLSDAAIKKLIRSAKKRGYVTHDQINSLSKEVNSEQIEDVLAMFSEMGVNVVETEEATADEEQQADEEPKAASWSKFSRRSRPSPRPRSRSSVPTTPCACIWFRGARSATFRSRGRLCAAEAGTSSLKSECVPKAVE